MPLTDILLPKGWRGGMSFESPSVSVIETFWGQKDESTINLKLKNRVIPMRNSPKTSPKDSSKDSKNDGFDQSKEKRYKVPEDVLLKIPPYFIVNDVSKVCFSSQAFLEKTGAKNQLSNVTVEDRILFVNGYSIPELAMEIINDGRGFESSTVANGSSIQPAKKPMPEKSLNAMMMDLSLGDVMKRGDKKKKKGKNGKNGKTSETTTEMTNETSRVLENGNSEATAAKEDASAEVARRIAPPGAFNTCRCHPKQPHFVGDIGKFDTVICTSCDFLRTIQQSGVAAAIQLWIRAVKDEDTTRIILTVETQNAET